MSRVQSKDTKPELVVRKFLFSKGLRYKIHDSKLPGRPDIVLLKFRTVIFVNGCFWHGHKNCRYFVYQKHARGFGLARLRKTKLETFKISQNLNNKIGKLF